MGPQGIPRGCQLLSQSCNGGSLEAQLSARPADRPHTHTRPGCAHLLAVLQECHCLAGGYAAHPAPFVPSDPRRDPGPGRVDHLHHHTPVTLCDHPTTRAASTAIAGLYVEHQSIWGANRTHQMEALQTDEQITPIKRHRAAGRVRHRPRSLTTAGEQVRSSLRTSTSTPKPPTNTRSPTPNPEEPVNVAEGDVVEFRFST